MCPCEKRHNTMELENLILQSRVQGVETPTMNLDLIPALIIILLLLLIFSHSHTSLPQYTYLCCVQSIWTPLYTLN